MKDDYQKQEYYKRETVLFEALKSNNVNFELYEHEAVYTVSESEKVNANIVGAHTKNLFLQDKHGLFYLVTVLADKRVDLQRLSNILGCGRFNFANAKGMQDYLSVSPGSVTPLAVMNDIHNTVTIILDEILAASPIVNVHPLRNTATISLSGLDLVRLLTQWQHAPTILTVPSKQISVSKTVPESLELKL